MEKKEEKEEKSKREKRKPYQKPALTVEELFEATVLGCLKQRGGGRSGCPDPRRTT
jgi:hypothetical protein